MPTGRFFALRCGGQVRTVPCATRGKTDALKTAGCEPGMRRTVSYATASICCFLIGCTPFHRPLSSAARSTNQPLSWLTQWVAAPLDTSPGFDPEILKSTAARRAVAPDDLLEITIWDLYEPGRPHTYPVRVSSELTLAAPLLGEVSIAKNAPQEIEHTLSAQYREREILLNPRLLVRSLDAPTLKVHVSGAVSQSGYVEIPRDEPTVYAALISAGGLKKNAGTEVGIQRRTTSERAVTAEASLVSTATIAATPEIQSIESLKPAPVHEPVSLANSTDVLSVSATGVVAPEPAAAGRSERIAPTVTEPLATRLDASMTPGPNPNHPPASASAEVRWYDLSRESDVAAVRELALKQGDEVIVKSAAPPIRISGLVHRPGPYYPPAGKRLNVWEALQLAGGVQSTDSSLNITLYRPAGEGHGSQRWLLHVDSVDERPATSPSVEPGDILHVEPTAAGRIKRAVGDLWNK